MLLGYAGLACIFLADTGRAPQSRAAWLGVLAVFASSIAYSAYLVLAERVVVQLGSLRFTGLAMSFACLFSLTHFFVLGRAHGHTPLPAAAVYACAVMALFSTVLPTWLLAEAVRRVGAGSAALCGMIGPVTTVALEVALLGEHATLADALGTSLVIMSVVLLTREKEPRVTSG
jgi:drug/metabolite transporter (DMT)-like permease